MWYFFNHRRVDAADAQPGIFANKNAGDPTKWTYEPDFTRQGRIDQKRNIYALRLTMQLTPKNKLSVFWDEQPQCSGAAWTGDDGCMSQQGRLDLRRQPGQRLLRRRSELARDRRLRRDAPEGAAGEVHRAGHQQAAARSRLRHLHLAVGLHRSGRAIRPRI